MPKKIKTKKKIKYEKMMKLPIINMTRTATL